MHSKVAVAKSVAAVAARPWHKPCDTLASVCNSVGKDPSAFDGTVIEGNGEQQVEALLKELLGDTSFGSWVGGELVLGKGDTITLVNPATGSGFL